MQDVLYIFVVGLGGVFIGMAALYVAIRLTSMAAERLTKGGAHDQ